MWLNVRWLTHAHPPLFVTSALFNKSWTAASSAGLQPRGGRTNIRYKAGVGIKTACSPWLFDGGWSAQCGADNWSNEPFIYCTDILTSTKGYLFFLSMQNDAPTSLLLWRFCLLLFSPGSSCLVFSYQLICWPGCCCAHLDIVHLPESLRNQKNEPQRWEAGNRATNTSPTIRRCRDF